MPFAKGVAIIVASFLVISGLVLGGLGLYYRENQKANALLDQVERDIRASKFKKP
jgi:hypothetical protein